MRSAEEITRINRAMTEANGDRDVAAAALGITKHALTNILNTTLALKTQWCKPRKLITVSPSELVQGMPLDLMSAELPAEVAARNQEAFDKLLAKSINPEAMAVNQTLAKMFGQHLEQCGNLVGGTLIERVLLLKEEIKKRQEEVDRGFVGEDAGTQLKATLEFIAAADNTIISVMEIINRTTTARAKLKEMEGGNNAGRPKGKPGFGPKTAIIAQNVTVGA